MRKTNDLGRDPVFRLVCRLAIPTMLAQLVSVLYSIVDRIYIGNIQGIGDLALAGVGVCGPSVTLLSSFASLVGLGGSPIMAMRMGEGRDREAGRVLSNSFLMLLILSGVLTTLFLLLKEHLLMWFGASDATFGYANTYLTIYTAGTFFALMATGMNSFLIAQGFSGLGMATVMLGAVLNIVLDPIFIFVLHLDVAGAALRLRPLLPAAETDAGTPAVGRLLLAHHAAGAGLRPVPLPHHRHGQHPADRAEHCAPALRRAGAGGYPGDLRHHRAELSAPHHHAHGRPYPG